MDGSQKTRKVDSFETYGPNSDKATFDHIVNRALYSTPCRCCGSSRHGLFSLLLNHNREEKIRVTCPVVEGGGDWQYILQRGVSSMRFPPNPKRFAIVHNRDTEEALKTFRLDGHAKQMDYMPLVDFESDVYSEVLRRRELMKKKKPQL